MDNLLESLCRLQQKLNEAHIETVAIGGIAVAAWGEARVTRDVEVRILLERSEAHRLLAALGAEYEPLGTDLPPALALQRMGMLFVRDQLGTRLDLLLSDIDFDREVVRRGIDVALGPQAKVRVCTAEDLIVYKVLAARPKDLADLPGIVMKQGKKLDVKYITRWLEIFEGMLDDSTLVETFRLYQE